MRTGHGAGVVELILVLEKIGAAGGEETGKERGLEVLGGGAEASSFGANRG